MSNSDDASLDLGEFQDFDTNTSEDDAILAGLDEIEEKSKKPAPPEKKEGEKEEKDPRYAKHSKEELLNIFDTLLFDGMYEELVRVGKSFTVKFRTRSVKESNEITRRIDKLELNTIMAVQNYTNVLTLAYAISELEGRKLVDMEFKERLDKINALPESLIILLSNKLRDFDMKVMAAMREGDENF